MLTALSRASGCVAAARTRVGGVIQRMYLASYNLDHITDEVPVGAGHMKELVDMRTPKTMKLKLNNEVTERRLGKIRPDYKYVDRNGMILGRNKTGMTAWNQKRMARAIKRARQFGLMPIIGKLTKYVDEDEENKKRSW